MYSNDVRVHGSTSFGSNIGWLVTTWPIILTFCVQITVGSCLFELSAAVVLGGPLMCNLYSFLDGFLGYCHGYL